MDVNKMKEAFKQQFREAIANYAEEATDYSENGIKCAFAAGILVILSALKMKDGPTIPTQIVIMHAALREVGDEMGWRVSK